MIVCRSPNDGRVLAEVPCATRGEIGEALANAAAVAPALDREAALRLDLLERFRERILAERAQLAALIVDEVGKTPAEAAAEVDYAAAFVAASIEAARGGLLAAQQLRGHRIRPTALGPALLIAPYNDPLAGITRKLAPALAAGCPALVKPSPLGLLCARALLGLLPDDALPGAARLLVAADEAMPGLVAAPELAVVSFTGSTATGRALALAAAQGPKPTLLELGGNNAFLVDADADLDRAAADLVARKLRAAGQACSSVNRVHAHHDIALPFLARLEERAAGLAPGAATTPGVGYGPVRGPGLKDRLERLATALGAIPGAKLMTGPPPVDGCALAVPFRWAILPEGSPDPLEQEEAFGPLLTVTPFTDREACLERIAAGRHNLAFYYYGGDPAFPERYRARCRHGSIGFNTTAIQASDVPTGGFAEAGFGREGGAWGVSAFLTTVNWVDPESRILPP
jgi:succinate-semialdehyde dehydrogenase/glutarate-semialdehyde dehydrogenase